MGQGREEGGKKMARSKGGCVKKVNIPTDGIDIAHFEGH